MFVLKKSQTGRYFNYGAKIPKQLPPKLGIIKASKSKKYRVFKRLQTQLRNNENGL